MPAAAAAAAAVAFSRARLSSLSTHFYSFPSREAKKRAIRCILEPDTAQKRSFNRATGRECIKAAAAETNVDDAGRRRSLASFFLSSRCPPPRPLFLRLSSIPLHQSALGRRPLYRPRRQAGSRRHLGPARPLGHLWAPRPPHERRHPWRRQALLRPLRSTLYLRSRALEAC